MVAFNKYNNFVKDFVDGVHDFDNHTFKFMLSNTAPNPATHVVRADASELSAGNGYTSGGVITTITTSIAGAIAKVSGTDAVITASGGGIGPFRYAILYNDTPTSPADPLIGFWDYGSSITLNSGDSFMFDINPSLGIFTVT